MPFATGTYGGASYGKKAAMFDSYPTYSPYRSLRLQQPLMVGEDVFAVQTLCAHLGAFPGVFDGAFGNKTDKAVRAVQDLCGATVDGVVGPKTWTAGVDLVAKGVRKKHGIATGLLYGQLKHESSFLGGNYSPKRADGTYDAGVAQRNTKFTQPVKGFDVPGSIEELAKNTKAYYTLFAGVPVKRRWTLAAGAWNAPAFACWYARAEGATKVKSSQTAKPSSAAAKAFSAYLAAVTLYLRT